MRGSGSSLRRRFRIGSYAALLFSMLLTLFFEPYTASTGPLTYLLREGLYVGIVIATLASAVGHVRALRLLVVIAVISEILILTHLIGRAPLNFAIVGEVIRIAFLLLAAAIVLGDVLRTDREVTLDKILGAACAYVLIGFAFALVYGLVYTVDPQAFLVGEELLRSTPSERVSPDVFVYFSFVTISTLGFGDVTPTLPFVRSVVMVETILGQFYIAVVVARLVTLHVSRRPGATHA